MKNILLIILLFGVLILLQTSFLVHFAIRGVVPNFILAAIILINFFEDPGKKLGILAAFLGGLFLDAFSQNFFGFYFLISMASSLFLKYLFRKHIRLWT